LHLHKFAFAPAHYAKIPSDEFFVPFLRKKREIGKNQGKKEII